MQHRNNRRAFTVIELIIVIAIVGILIALLLPAIQAARAAARRTQSMNNLRNLSVATINHEVTRRGFPTLFSSADEKLHKILNPADAADAYPWTVSLLPFLEESAMYKAIDNASQSFKLPSTQVKFGAGMTAPGTVDIAIFEAPQLKESAVQGMCNYIALPATRQPLLTDVTANKDGQQVWGKIPPEGILVPTGKRQGIQSLQIRDGMSKTLLLSESRERTRSNWYAPQQTFACGFLPADSKPIDEAKSQYYPYFDAEKKWVFNPAAGDRSALNYGPAVVPNLLPFGGEKAFARFYNDDPKDPLARNWGPSGGHPGGVTCAAMADGSVRSIDDTLDPQVFFGLLTRNGGEEAALP